MYDRTIKTQPVCMKWRYNDCKAKVTGTELNPLSCAAGKKHLTYVPTQFPISSSSFWCSEENENGIVATYHVSS